jgi:hypothetical protein
MTHIDAEGLLPDERLREAVLDGEITQLHRGDAHAAEGDTFAIGGTEFGVTDVTERRLGELTDADARMEGSPDLDTYRERIERTHGIEWNEEDTAVRHRFERRE